MSAKDEMLARARAMMDHAYAPYLAFHVGACVRGESGALYAGCNVQNAALPQGWCAETSAIAAMVAAGVSRARLPAANEVLCPLGDARVPELARRAGPTRSAAAVELWLPHLGGAVVAIGNAPTALYRLLEVLEAGAPRPAVVLAFPVGFVGAAESKEALIAAQVGIPYLTLRGRRGGSALAAAAVNAVASP